MEFVTHITNAITDEVVADIAAEKSLPLGKKTWDWICRFHERKTWPQQIQHRATCIRTRLKRPVIWPRPMRALIALTARYRSLGMARQNLVRGINNPIARNLAIAALIMGAAAAVGYGWPVMVATAVGAFGLKLAAAEAVGALAWTWRRYVRRDCVKTSSLVVLWRQASLRQLPQHVCRVTFSTAQKNTTLNALDMMLTVCSGVLLLPLVAQIQTSFLQNIGGRAAVRGVGRPASNLLLSETIMAAETATPPMLRSTGLAVVEQSAAARIGWGRVMQLVQDLPERLLTTGEQAATKVLGHQLARQQALRELAM